MGSKALILAGDPGPASVARLAREGYAIFSNHPVIAEKYASLAEYRQSRHLAFSKELWAKIDGETKEILAGMAGRGQISALLACHGLESFLLVRKILFEIHFARINGIEHPGTLIFLPEIGFFQPWRKSVALGQCAKAAILATASFFREVSRKIRAHHLPEACESTAIFCLEKPQRDSVSIAFKRLLDSRKYSGEFSLLWLKPVGKNSILEEFWGRKPIRTLSPWEWPPSWMDLFRSASISVSVLIRAASLSLRLLFSGRGSRLPVIALGFQLGIRAVTKLLPLCHEDAIFRLASHGPSRAVVATERHTASALFLNTWKKAGGEISLIQHGVLANLETNRQANFPSIADYVYSWGEESAQFYLRNLPPPKYIDYLPLFREEPSITAENAGPKRVCYMGQNFHYSKGLALFECFVHAVAGLPDGVFIPVVRPHGAKSPDAGAEFYQSILSRKQPGVMVVNRGTAEEEIRHSNIVITSTSTTYLEALYLGKHVILLDLDLESAPPLEQFEAGRVVKNASELKEAIIEMAELEPNRAGIHRYLEFSCMKKTEAL